MKHKKWLLIALILPALLIVSGCVSLFNGDQPEDLQQAAQTYSAQTKAAQNQVETIVAQTLATMPTRDVDTAEPPSPSTTATAMPTMPPTVTLTLLPTLTFTPSVPVVEVSVATNCRTGPGKIYDWVSVLNVGKQVEVVARNASGTYWVVKNPAGAGVCWLWDSYATVSGSTAGLPVWEAPPTPTSKADVTPTPTEVLLQVSVPTNCRVGPGRLYEIVSILRPGTSVKVFARHATADFWVVENPKGDGQCWVWGEYATFTGLTAGLPVREAPPTPTPKPDQTPTPTGVLLQVSVPTNCRVGPGRAYDIVSVMRPGKTAMVIARHGSADFWVIENPEGSSYCWVWGEYATITGSTASLPTWDPPATPTPTPTKGN